MKRAFDIVTAGIAIVLFSPFILGIAALVRLRLGSPVLFRQERPGLGGRPFTLLKFRTMLHDAGPDGAPMPDGKRLTPFGRRLRASSLDELPELWNILRGDMSFVGPRPLLLDYLPHYSPEQSRRHEVRPGLTGWAQINGRNAIDWDQRLALDVWYVDNRSFALDMRILARTISAVLRREGINAEGHATVPRFDDYCRSKSGGRGVAGQPGTAGSDQRSHLGRSGETLGALCTSAAQ